MIIRKWRLFPAEIKAFADCWGQSIVGDSENGGQDASEHTGLIFEVR